MFRSLLVSVTTGAILFIAGCTSDDTTVTPPVTAEMTALTLHFVPMFGTAPLVFNKKYLNAGGDSVQFITAKFYLSDVHLVDSLGRLTPVDGFSFVNFASLTNGAVDVTLQGPVGTYRGITFSVGVPLEENHKDAATQSLPLGPNSGMYWGWNPGYIFHMMEGKVDSAAVQRDFFFHVGEDSRRGTIMLASLAGSTKTVYTVQKGAANTFSIAVDYAKLFSVGLDGVNPMKLSLHPDERAHHVTPAQLANRTFANTLTMFSRIP